MSSYNPSSQPSPHRALLLLPPPPAPPTYAALKAAYNAPVFSVLRELARSPRRAQEPAVLEIALPCPHLYGLLDRPRGPLYATTQQLVADLYKLVCVIAANEAIDTEDTEGVDARVILVAYPRDGKLVLPANDTTTEEELQGPAIDLHMLARTPRQWDTVYSVESEEGEGVLKNFLSLSSSGSPRNVSKVRGGIVHVEPTAPEVAPPEKATATDHFSVILGGTFDHLHIGHKLLLTMFAFVLSRRSSSSSADITAAAAAAQNSGPSTLTIGITGDELLKNKKYAEQLESWKKRQEATHEFLSSILYFGPADDQRIETTELNEPGPNGHAVLVTYPFNLVIKYVEIWDPYGPTITDPSVTAIVVSLETRGGGAAVNKKRAELNWGQLEVFEVDVLDASEEANLDETFQSKLSSTEIRRKRSERARSSTGA